MGGDQLRAVLGKLQEAGAIHGERLHDPPKTFLDFLVHLGRQQIDEPRGEIGQEALEPRTLIQKLFGLRRWGTHRSGIASSARRLRFEVVSVVVTTTSRVTSL